MAPQLSHNIQIFKIIFKKLVCGQLSENLCHKSVSGATRDATTTMHFSYVGFCHFPLYTRRWVVRDWVTLWLEINSFASKILIETFALINKTNKFFQKVCSIFFYWIIFALKNNALASTHQLLCSHSYNFKIKRIIIIEVILKIWNNK